MLTTMQLLISDVFYQLQCHSLFQMLSVIHNVTPYFRCQSQCHSVFQMSFVNRDATSYFRCHLSTTMSLISDVICQPQCHFLFQMSPVKSQCHSVFQMTSINHNVTSYFRCLLSTTMSLHIFKCHTVTKLLLAIVRQNTAWQRSISMANSMAPPLWKRSLLRGSVTFNVRVWSCKTYRVKTPALLEGGQRWMLHVSINNKHRKTIFYKV